MEFKPGVRILGIRPELILAAIVADGLCREYGFPFVITSGTESTHHVGSIHYSGGAFDMRIRELELARREEFKVKLRARLGADFDVILESDHVHVEYQPKLPY